MAPRPAPLRRKIMINWQELAARAAAGPWTEEEYSALIRLTEVSPSAANLSGIVELIKSARFPGHPQMEDELIPDMSFAVWGEKGSLLDWSQRRRFTDLTLKTAAGLTAAVNAAEEEIASIYSACLAYRLAKPMLFAV